MGAASERRALLLQADDAYDPYLTIDVNEYLIENYPTLTAKNRQSVWHLCQNDEDFDYDSIHDQIDDWVYEYAESNPEVILEDSPEQDEDEDDMSENTDAEDEEDIESLVYVDLEEYIEDNYEEIDEDELPYLIELITYKFDYKSVYDQIDQIVSNYNDGQYDDELEETLNEEEEAIE
tara:strand:+ start:639 stop:1172 length:534 start_codon:yes stop_codon:yes gene_type:complete